VNGGIFDRTPAVEPLLPATSERARPPRGHACTLDLVLEAPESVSPPRFRSERFVCSVAVENGHFKLVQLVFQKSDGSVRVAFPYGPECDGLVSVATISAHGIAGYDRFIEVLLGGMTSLELDSKSQAELVHTLLGAYFETLQSDLVVARAYQVKIDALGPAARERRRESLKPFAAFIRELVARTSPDGRPPAELPWSA